MEDQNRQKAAFAAILYRQPGAKPFEVALSLFPAVGEALEVSQTWPSDPFVLDEIARLSGAAHEDENRLPSKEDLCRKVWGWIDGQGGSMTFDEKIKAAKLYAELNEMIKKPEAVTKSTENNTWHVMEVRTHGTDDEWSVKLARQQQQLQQAGLAEIEGSIVDSQ